MTDRPIDSTDRHRPTDSGASTKALGPASTAPIDRPALTPTVDADRAEAVESTDREAGSTDDPTVDEAEPWALRVGLTGALWILSTVASLMTSVGQVGFAEWAHLHGLIRYGVPVILDMFDVVLLLLGYRQGRRKRSPYPLWFLAGLVAGFGFYTNVVHAGHRAGLIFGAASAVTFVSWLVKLRIDLTKYLVSIKHIPPGRPKFGKLALVAPRVALHAWTVTVRRRVTDGDKAVECAETWIVVYDDTLAALLKLATKRGTARRLAKRTAWHHIFAMTNGPKVAMPQSATVETVNVTIGSTEPTDGVTDDRPTAPESTTPVAPTVDHSTADRPTDRESPTEPTADRSPTIDRAPRRPTAARRPSPKPTDDRPSSAAVANARLLRTEFYPTGLPAEYSIGQVRGDTGWSFERARDAVSAYRGGADLDDSEPDRAVNLLTSAAS